MKGFLRRLKLYGIGFGIGLVFVFFFFQNRGCTWLPSNRVKNSILGRVIVIQSDQEALLLKNGISKDEVINFLNDGSVEFGKSKKTGNPQVYSLSKELNGKEVKLWFTLPANSYISEVKWPEGSIQKADNSAEGIGSMIHFPNVKSMIFLKDGKRFVCQQDKTGLIATSQVYKRLKSTGKIDFAQSDLKLTPRAHHYISFTSEKGEKIDAVTVWEKEHISFDGFILADTTGCP